MILNYVIYIPLIILLEEPVRCSTDGLNNDYNFTCFDKEHISILTFSSVISFSLLLLVVYTNLFVNCQFPNEKLPFSCWDRIPAVIKSVWKIIYIYHYDVLDERYYTAMRLGSFIFLVYIIYKRMNLPKIYHRLTNYYTLI
jgi:hypothetical protein